METSDHHPPIDFELLVEPLLKAGWITGTHIAKLDDLYLSLTPKGRAGMLALMKRTGTLWLPKRSWWRTVRFFFWCSIVCAQHGLWPVRAELLHQLLAVAARIRAGTDIRPVLTSGLERACVGMCESAFALVQSQREQTKEILKLLESQNVLCVALTEHLIAQTASSDERKALEQRKHSTIESSTALIRRVRHELANAERTSDQIEAGLADLKKQL